MAADAYRDALRSEEALVLAERLVTLGPVLLNETFLYKTVIWAEMQQDNATGQPIPVFCSRPRLTWETHTYTENPAWVADYRRHLHLRRRASQRYRVIRSKVERAIMAASWYKPGFDPAWDMTPKSRFVQIGPWTAFWQVTFRGEPEFFWSWAYSPMDMTNVPLDASDKPR